MSKFKQPTTWQNLYKFCQTLNEGLYNPWPDNGRPRNNDDPDALYVHQDHTRVDVGHKSDGEYGIEPYMTVVYTIIATGDVGISIVDSNGVADSNNLRWYPATYGIVSSIDDFISSYSGCQHRSDLIKRSVGLLLDMLGEYSAPKALSNNTTAVINTAAELNESIRALNSFNDGYPRRCGTLVMCSSEKEDEAEALVNTIEGYWNFLSKLTDSIISEYVCNDVEEYRDFLNNVRQCIDINREEIARSREFLGRYFSR